MFNRTEFIRHAKWQTRRLWLAYTHIGNYNYLSRDRLPSAASNLIPFRARRHKLSQKTSTPKKRQQENYFFAFRYEIFVLKIAFHGSSLHWRQLEYKGHISRGFHFAIRCHCLVDQSESGAGQAVVSYISRAHRLLIWTNDVRELYNECQSSRFNHGQIMSWLANGTSLNSLAYRGIGVDFSNIEYVFSWSFTFWYETRKKRWIRYRSLLGKIVKEYKPFIKITSKKNWMGKFVIKFF